MAMERRFLTALRDYVWEKIERLGGADIVVGGRLIIARIPSCM